MPQCQFLFSAVFVFQKSCTGNILRIGRNKSRSSYFSVMKTEPEGETEKSHEVATSPLGAGQPQATPIHGVGPSGTHRPRPFAYKLPPYAKTLEESASIHEKFRRGRHRRNKFRGTEVSVPAPCRDGELPPEPSPLTPPPSSSPLLTPMMRRE